MNYQTAMGICDNLEQHHNSSTIILKIRTHVSLIPIFSINTANNVSSSFDISIICEVKIKIPMQMIH